MSEEAVRGVEQVAKGQYPWFEFTPEILKAIEEGFVFDADPTWMYQDIGASVKARLTFDGLAVAKSHKWLVPCRCPLCHLDAVQGDRYGGYCTSCGSSVRQYGATNDQACKFHVVMRKKRPK